MAEFSLTGEFGGTNTRSLAHPLHGIKLLKALNESRKSTSLCDGIVVFSDGEVPVQRNVLASVSPYFRGVYKYDHDQMPADNHTRHHMNEINGLNKATFMKILDYIYTSTIKLCEENIQDILQAADLLLMADLKELCCDYLEQCISTQNCLGIRQFAELFNCPQVHYLATRFMDEHFVYITYEEEFLQLPFPAVKALLLRKTLSVQTEDAIFDSLMRWIKYDVESRSPYLKELLESCVHMRLLDERYLQEYVIPEPLIHSAGLESLVMHLRQENDSHRQRGYTSMLVVTGGEGPTTRDQQAVEVKPIVQCINVNRDEESHVTWIPLAKMNQPRVGHGLVEAGGKLYAIGGRDNAGILFTGECYSPETNTWTPIARMHHARVGFGLVSIDDKIYAIGGSNDMSDPLVSAEEYNIYTDTWRQLPDMNLKRAWSSHAVANKKIYVIGGGIMGKLYENVECFDPRSESWTSVAPMKERRYDCRSISHGEDIYVFGGYRRVECPSALQYGSGMKFCGTEVYHTSKQHWLMMDRNAQMCTMTESSHIDAVVGSGDEILVVGELEMGNDLFHYVRGYHPLSNTWRSVVLARPAGQRGAQACMLKIPNNMFQTPGQLSVNTTSTS